MASSTDSQHVAAGPSSAKQRRRKRISDAATALFHERGFEGVSIADIAAAAGVSKMTVTNHFALKEDLIFDEFDEQLRDIRARLEPAASLTDAVDVIERHCIERESNGGTARALAPAAPGGAWQGFAGLVLSSRTLTQRFHAHYLDVRDAIADALPATAGARGAVAAWLLAETVHLVDWWPFDAVRQGMSTAQIRSGRPEVRARAFTALRDGVLSGD
jgi:AcrR family transcriptional regulator